MLRPDEILFYYPFLLRNPHDLFLIKGPFFYKESEIQLLVDHEFIVPWLCKPYREFATVTEIYQHVIREKGLQAKRHVVYAFFWKFIAFFLTHLLPVSLVNRIKNPYYIFFVARIYAQNPDRAVTFGRNYALEQLYHDQYFQLHTRPLLNITEVKGNFQFGTFKELGVKLDDLKLFCAPDFIELKRPEILKGLRNLTSLSIGSGSHFIDNTVLRHLPKLEDVHFSCSSIPSFDKKYLTRKLKFINLFMVSYSSSSLLNVYSKALYLLLYEDEVLCELKDSPEIEEVGLGFEDRRTDFTIDNLSKLVVLKIYIHGDDCSHRIVVKNCPNLEEIKLWNIINASNEDVCIVKKDDSNSFIVWE